MQFKQYRKPQLGWHYRFDSPTRSYDHVYFVTEKLEDNDDNRNAIAKMLDDVTKQFGPMFTDNRATRWMSKVMQYAYEESELQFGDGDWSVAGSCRPNEVLRLEIVFKDEADAVVFKLSQSVK
jgi:hypothetical protein